MPNPPCPKPTSDHAPVLVPLPPLANEDMPVKATRSFHDLDPNDPRACRNRLTTAVTTSQGVVSIDDLDIPEDIKHLLETLDFDGSKTVHQHELEEIVKLLKNLKGSLDTDN